MKRQVILDEDDIIQLHDDALHLDWIYKRMHMQHKENHCVDYMIRFAKIINKLQNL